MTKRMIPMTFTALMAAAALAGCAGKTQESIPAGTQEKTQSEAQSDTVSGGDSTGKVQLNYYAWSEGDYLQDIVDAYNAQSTVAEVKMTQVNSNDYEDKLFTMLAGKNDIDIFNLRSGSMASDLASTGNLVDISQNIKDSGLDLGIYGTGFAETKYDGKFYVLPYRSSSYGLFYNKKMFDEKGIAYPDNLTWDEYGKLAMELTEGEGKDKIYGSYIPDWNSCTYEVIQKGSNLADDDLTPLKIWMERLNQYYNIDNSHMSFTDMRSSGTDGINFFTTGNCYMYPGGEWSISDALAMLKKNPQLKDTFELGIAMIPQVDKEGEKLTIGGVSTFVGINAASEKQEAAFDFVQFMAGKEAALITASYGAIPAYIDDDVINTFEESIGVDGAGNMLDISKVSETLFIPGYSDITNIYVEELELYLIGEQTLDEAVKNFEERRAELNS